MSSTRRSEAGATLANAARTTPREAFRDDHSGDARQPPQRAMATDEISDAVEMVRPTRRRHRLQGVFASRTTLRQAVLLTEILGYPKALQPPPAEQRR